MAFNPLLCAGCPIEGCHTPVDGNGAEDARFLVVTDVPTRAAAKEGRLLSNGDARIFGEAMSKVGFVRNDFRYVPLARCAYDPHDHTNKEKAAIHKHCRVHLLNEIEQYPREAIIPLGASAASATLGRAIKITNVRGAGHTVDTIDAPIFPLMSPTVVRNYPQNAPVFTADVEAFKRFIDAGGDMQAAQESRRTGSYTRVRDLQFLLDQDPDAELILSFDTENTGLRWYQPGVNVRSYNPNYHHKSVIFKPQFQILTMQFSVREGESFVLVWDHPEDPIPEADKPRLRNQIRKLLCHPNRIVIGQRVKYDCVALWMAEGIRFRIGGDTNMLLALVDENATEKNLDIATKIYVNALAGYADNFNRTVDKSRMWEVPIDRIIEYGGGDSDATLRLYNVLEDMVMGDQKLWAHYVRVSIPGLNALAGLEVEGMYTDVVHALPDFRATMEHEVEESRVSLLNDLPSGLKRAIVDDYRRKPDAKGKQDKSRLNARPEDVLSFGRTDFVREILFTHPKGFKLKPKVFTKSTAELNDTKARLPSTSSKDHLPYFFEEEPYTLRLAEYVKDARMLGTSVIKFEENYIVGGKVRPTYQLADTVTGRVNCFVGETPIQTPRGEIPIADLRTDDLVYCYDNDLRLTLRRVTAQARTGFRDLVRVTYLTQGGRHTKHVDCTPDHPFRLRDGSYVRADQLQKGHRMLSLEREVKPSGYALLYATGYAPTFEHQFVYGVYHPQGAENVHHLDGDTLNNHPRNLEGMTASDHHRLQYNCRGERFDDLMTAARAATPVGAAAKILGVGYYRAASMLESDNNHTVLSVEALPNRQWVYDISVDEFPNFIANGVCVHNSQDPNGQNYPKRGTRAKVYRKMFVAPPAGWTMADSPFRYLAPDSTEEDDDEWIVIECDLSQAEMRIAACYANDPTLLAIYREGGDVHTTTAQVVMGVTGAQWSLLSKAQRKAGRQKAKAVNFGFIFGMGWRKFIGYAKTQYGVEFTETEAQHVRERFFSKYSRLAGWHKAVRAFVRKLKYVRGYTGRIRHLPMVDSAEDYIAAEAERQGINSSVQGVSSDLGVMALGRITEEIDPRYMRPVGFIHDAIVVYVRRRHLDWGARTLKTYMQTNPLKEWFGVELKCPIVADVSFGLNLGEVYECEGFSLDTPFDYDSVLRDDEGNLAFQLPAQEVPPNGGRLQRSAFTTDMDLEPEDVHVVERSVRITRAIARPETLKRIDRSSRQMKINKRNQQARVEEARAVRRILRTPPRTK